jgi:RNA polymerase sigma-70 factor, ECF subfamily
MMGLMAGSLEAIVDSRASTREFGSWMASEQKRIFLLCRRMLQDSEEADAATQDTFLKAWQAMTKANTNTEARELDDPGKWVARIAVNTCLDRLRSRRWQFWRKRPSPEDEATILAFAAAPNPSAEDQAFAVEIDQRLGRALDKLSLRQRSVFTLRHYENLSLAEIAEVLQLDVGTVKAHLFRAIEKMREELRDLYFRGPNRTATVKERGNEK